MLNDLCYALRQLRKNPGFTAVAVFTLALGIAGNIVIFSFFNAFYLRPFPFVDADRLVDMDETAPRWNLEYTALAYPDFAGWRELNRSFDGMAAWAYENYNFSFEGMVERVRGARVTHDLTAVLGIQPILGRSFSAEEDRPGGVKVVLLGNGFWMRQFGGRKDVVGQTLRLNHEPCMILGVLPPDNDVLVEAELWVPLAADPHVHKGYYLHGVGRLRNGVTLKMARDDLARVHQNLIDNKRINENTFPKLTPLSERFFGQARLVIRVLLGAVGVVLLIACGNVAALMLARGLARSRELGLRMSLGASPRRMARLIGVESLVLAGAGGLAGIYLGYWGLQVLLRSIAQQPPRWIQFDMDWRTWLFAGCMVLVSALLGAWPVIRSASRIDLRETLQSSAQQSTASRGRRRTLHALIVAEVALTLVLMVQAALLLQAFRLLQRADPGCRPEQVLVYEIALPSVKYGPNEALQAFFDDHLERVRALPGVVAASGVNVPPLSGHSGNFYTIEDAPPKGPNDPDPVVLQRIAFPGYFETMGISLITGRSFDKQDGLNKGSQAVIVNEIFAQRFWPNQNPIGRRISHRYPNAPWITVVGVARDVKHYGVDQLMIPGVYFPFAQDVQRVMSIVLRGSATPTALVPAIRALVRASDPDLAVFGVVTMEERLAQSLWVRRLTASLLGIFAGVALLMAVGGIYGVFSYVINRRTQEIGLRLALGGQPRDVLWLVARQGLALSSLGIGIGLVVALATTPFTRGLLFGVSPVDPLTFMAIALLLTLIALMACWMPARRAARVDPMVALRCE
jgi:putative ABC transport system permease protein